MRAFGIEPLRLLPCRESEANEELMKAIDRQYIRTPFYGSRRMVIWLRGQGYAVDRKRVMRLMMRLRSTSAST